MKMYASVILGLIVASSTTLSAHAAAKCVVEKTKFSTSQQKLTTQERKIDSLERQQENIISRGAERTASLEGRVQDAEGQLTSAHINAGGDVIACYLSPNRCADSTVRNTARRYGAAMRNLERAKGQLTAWQTAQSRKLDTIQKRVVKETKVLEVRKQEAATAEAAYQRCIG